MNQTIRGAAFEVQRIQRLEAMFYTLDYVWERDPSTNDRIALIGINDANGEGESKLRLLKQMVYAEGYGR